MNGIYLDMAFFHVWAIFLNLPQVSVFPLSLPMFDGAQPEEIISSSDEELDFMVVEGEEGEANLRSGGCQQQW